MVFPAQQNTGTCAVCKFSFSDQITEDFYVADFHVLLHLSCCFFYNLQFLAASLHQSNYDGILSSSVICS